MLCGMYLDGMNVWFINACETWQGKYYTKNVSTTKERNWSGFVASNIQYSVPGKIQRTVKYVLNKNHHEFISCCQLPPYTRVFLNETTIECHNMWTVYLYKQKSDATDKNCTTQLHTSVHMICKLIGLHNRF